MRAISSMFIQPSRRRWFGAYLGHVRAHWPDGAPRELSDRSLPLPAADEYSMFIQPSRLDTGFRVSESDRTGNWVRIVWFQSRQLDGSTGRHDGVELPPTIFSSRQRLPVSTETLKG